MKKLSNNSFTQVNIIGPMNCPNILDNKDTFYIFVDGGTEKLNEIKPSNFISVGDNDSSDKKHDFTYPQKKDRSDLYLAFTHCPLVKEIRMYGFLGGRKDHEIFNLGESYNYLKNNKKCSKISFYDEKKIKQVTIINSHKSEISYCGSFSITSLENQLINIDGDIEYKGDYNLIPLSSQGLSNYSKGRITINSQAPLIIYFNHDLL